MRTTVYVPCVVLLFGWTASALHHAPLSRASAIPPVVASDSTAITQSMIDAGRQSFHGPGGCVTCHGEQLQGSSVAPTLRAHKWKDAGDGSYEDIKKVVSSGVQGTAMVSHPGGISDDQVAKVAAYVWAVSQGKTKP